MTIAPVLAPMPGLAQAPRPPPEIITFRDLPTVRPAASLRGREGTLDEQFQVLLDETAPRLNGKGITMGVMIPGRDAWVGAAGYADRGGAVLRDEHGVILRDEYELPMREGAVRMMPDDLMYIGSCTKT